MDKADLEANMETANAEGWELEQFTVDPNNCYVAVMVRSKEEPEPVPEDKIVRGRDGKPLVGTVWA
jgi:hypothetical protein